MLARAVGCGSVNKKVWVELLKENATVTEPYLRCIGSCYASTGCAVEYLYDISAVGVPTDDIYVVAVAPSAVKLARRGCKHIVFWAQGIWPEESYQRNGSNLRLKICNIVEKKALRKSEKLFLVSNAQLEHYEHKYRFSLKHKSYIMPCSNEIFHEESFDYEGKYKHPVFVYAGSLAKYQCIDGMLDAFTQAQSVCPEARLLFYTGQQNEAKALIEARGLKNVTIGFSKPEELHLVLAKAKYGFVIRDDSDVNRVDTPTKISSYISNGVIPVYSPTLQAFEETSGGIIKLPYNAETFAEQFLKMEESQIDPKTMREMYKSYFDQQFNLDLHSSAIICFIEGRNFDK